MAVIRRGSRTYVYRSVWRDGRVTSVYVGSGDDLAEVDRCEARLRRMFRVERQGELAGAREARELERARRKAAREELDAVRAARSTTEAAVDEFCESSQKTLAAAMAACGYRRRQGEWRRNRSNKMSTTTEIARSEGFSQPTVFGGMLGRVEVALAAREGTTPEAMRARLEALSWQIAGPTATPLERMLAGRIAVCLIDADRCDAEANRPGFLGMDDLAPGNVEATLLRLAKLGPAYLRQQIQDADRARDRSYRRLAVAVRALADATRRPSVLAVQVRWPAGESGGDQVAEVGVAGTLR